MPRNTSGYSPVAGWPLKCLLPFLCLPHACQVSEVMAATPRSTARSSLVAGCPLTVAPSNINPSEAAASSTT